MHEVPEKADEGDGQGGGASRETSGGPYITVELNPDQHRIAEFRCKQSPRVEGFFVKEYPEYSKSNYSRVYVCMDAADPGRILGYYTLSAAAMARNWLGNKFTRDGRTPGGIDAPMVRIGFMGRDDTAAKGLGGALVHDAALRAYHSGVGVWGIVLDAETDGLVEKFYGKLGFVLAVSKRNPDEVPPRLMYAPLASLLPK